MANPAPPPRTPRLAPPTWLTTGLRPQPAQVPWPAVARASIALAAPLAVGFATERPAYGALVSMGALSGVIGDTADAYRMRVFNIAVPQLFGALGVTLGALVFGQGWLAVAALTLIALVSGMISSIGAVASVSGLLLLLNAVVGAGLPMPDPWWKAPLLLGLGGVVVLTLTLLGWPLRGGQPERAAVAGTYRAIADLFEAAGTDAYDEKRQAVTASLNQSYDLVLGRRARQHGRAPTLVRLLAQLNVVIPMAEAAPAAHLAARRFHRPLPPEVPAAVRDLADAVETGRTGDPDLRLPEARRPSEKAVEASVRYAATVVHQAEHSPYQAFNAAKGADRLGRPAALRVRMRRAARGVLLSGASWRYGLRLALCIGLSQALVSLIAVPRSYWVALTVTFVMKPDFGSVFSRAVLRAFGTAAGLLVAAPILAALPRGWGDVPVMLVLAALIPAFSAKGYAFQTAAITPVILLLSDLLNHQGFHLVLPRLYDSLVGCAIALVAGDLLWPESWHTRVADRLADAVEDTAAYVNLAFGAPSRTGGGGGDAEPEHHGGNDDHGNAGDQGTRVRARRKLYRDMSSVRSEFQRALTEPPPAGDLAAAWWPLTIAVERIVDATTAARVRVDHGAPAPHPAEVALVERQLRELAEGLRSSEVLVEVRADLSGDEDGVLAPLRQEVRAARAIATPSPNAATTPSPSAVTTVPEGSGTTASSPPETGSSRSPGSAPDPTSGPVPDPPRDGGSAP
ncbi:FUSC family protein [Streptomyces roseicoloratus]|uniref:FUSC family protein n=1 Tax=Streptomyces roseicoloratus TaxID=2508722 RepID=A0ABY9RVH9_9ACTN|nr:FUSC family protein [Streptomyces roseicoloratus]WMX46180.1 FUSC family protein [Streptomyces roseicoloratus]